MGTYRVTVETEFAASHQLRMHDGEFEPLHGHQWRVLARFSGGGLDQIDVLIDFVKVQQCLDDIVAAFHDRHLNDLPCFGQTNPSAENVARAIYESIHDELDTPELLERVTVWEAANCSASYGRNG